MQHLQSHTTEQKDHRLDHNITMTTPAPVVRVGVAAVVRDAQGRMVVGVRKGSHGDGAWSNVCFRWRLPESGRFQC